MSTDNQEIDDQEEEFCSECGDELDTNCQGEVYCPSCDGPCPSCHDGGGPGLDDPIKVFVREDVFDDYMGPDPDGIYRLDDDED